MRQSNMSVSRGDRHNRCIFSFLLSLSHMTFMMPCEHRTPMEMLGMGIRQDSEQAQGRQAFNYECLGHWQPKKPHYQLYKNFLATQKKRQQWSKKHKKAPEFIISFLIQVIILPCSSSLLILKMMTWKGNTGQHILLFLSVFPQSAVSWGRQFK